MFQFQIPKFIVEEPRLTLSLIKCLKKKVYKFARFEIISWIRNKKQSAQLYLARSRKIVE